jgi:hypothetical protein
MKMIEDEATYQLLGKISQKLKEPQMNLGVREAWNTK